MSDHIRFKVHNIYESMSHSDLSRLNSSYYREDDQDGCWVWIGPVKKGKNGAASPIFTFRHTSVSARSLVYHAKIGIVVPEDPNFMTIINNRCDNRLCVNPSHTSESLRRIRSDYASRTTCSRGHTTEDIEKFGARCRTCADILQKERRQEISTEWHLKATQLLRKF